MARTDELYRYLTSQTEAKKTDEILRDLSWVYPGYNGDAYRSGARRKLTKDIRDINNDPAFPKLIISGNKGIKVADEGEAERFLNAETRELFGKLKTVRELKKKAGLDGQTDIEEGIREVFR